MGSERVVHAIVTMHPSSPSDWLDVHSGILGVMVTCFAVVVALFQSWMAWRQANLNKREQSRPQVFIDWFQTRAVPKTGGRQPITTETEWLMVHVTNLGTGPAVDTCVEFQGPRGTAKTAGILREVPPPELVVGTLPIEQRPIVHLTAGGEIVLVINAIFQSLPTDLRARTVYHSVFGETFMSDWCTVEIPVGSQRFGWKGNP